MANYAVERVKEFDPVMGDVTVHPTPEDEKAGGSAMRKKAKGQHSKWNKRFTCLLGS